MHIHTHTHTVLLLLLLCPAIDVTATGRTKGDPAGAFSGADVVVEDVYGNDVITHCCSRRPTAW
jgi:hypothetical protein